MFQEEYVRLAKSVENISDEQAKQIVGTVLDKLKVEVRAIIVDVWVHEPGKDAVDILVSYLRRSDPQVPGPQSIALTEKATGLLVWVAETRKPVWLDDIPVQATSAVNRLTGQMIEGRHFNLYDGTRAFAAVPSASRCRWSRCCANCGRSRNWRSGTRALTPPQIIRLDEVTPPFVAQQPSQQ
jgi:hypothetical protein